MKLTAQSVSRLKLPPTGQRDVKDDITTGLYLRIHANGTRVWRYRYKLSGKVRILSLGRVDQISLAEARGKARAAKEQFRIGNNPAAEAQRQAADRLRMPTFEEFAHEYIERHAKPNKKTWRDDLGVLTNWVIPRIGQLKLEDIQRRDVVAVIDAVRDAGHTRMPGYALAVMRRLFRFAIERGVLESGPVLYITERQPKPARKAMDQSEIKVWWQATANALIPTSMAYALQLLLLTGQRPGEVAGLCITELELDHAEGPRWNIPGERRKSGKPHTVAITPWALEVIRKALPFSNAEYLFPNSNGGPGRPDSGLARAVKLAFDDMPARPTPHSARHTVATELELLEFDETDVARVLGHASQSVTGKVYINRRSVNAQRRILEAWERRLREIVTSEPLDNVVTLSTWSS